MGRKWPAEVQEARPLGVGSERDEQVVLDIERRVGRQLVLPEPELPAGLEVSRDHAADVLWQRVAVRVPELEVEHPDCCIGQAAMGSRLIARRLNVAAQLADQRVVSLGDDAALESTPHEIVDLELGPADAVTGLPGMTS